jgi:hypothetical protein
MSTAPILPDLFCDALLRAASNPRYGDGLRSSLVDLVDLAISRPDAGEILREAIDGHATITETIRMLRRPRLVS